VPGNPLEGVRIIACPFGDHRDSMASGDTRSSVATDDRS
jgi:hypothetical protein